MKRVARQIRRAGLYPLLFILVCVLLATALFGRDEALTVSGDWQLSTRTQISLCIVLLLSIAAAQWISLLWFRARSRHPRIGWQLLILVVAVYLGMSSSPRAIALERDIALTESVGPEGPIMTHDRRFLTPFWQWTAPFGAPLTQPDSHEQTRFLFRVSPISDRENVGKMSCPDFVQSRGAFVSSDRRIALDRADLPPGSHVDFEALRLFCWPGVHLSPEVEASLSPQAKGYLARVAGPRDTAFTPFEIAAAEGQQTLSREISRQPSARGRYLLFLALGKNAAKELPLGEALFGAEDYFFAANQCDADYARFLGQQGVFYPQDAALYLARELSNTFETDAQLKRPNAFVLGLAPDSTPKICQTTLSVLVDLAGGVSQVTPEVAKLL